MDSASMNSAYRGSVPNVRCRDVSGADCERVMPDDAEDCGIREHVRLKSPPKAPGEEGFISQPRQHKPRLSVNEDYDLVRPARDVAADRALPDLDLATFQ